MSRILYMIVGGVLGSSVLACTGGSQGVIVNDIEPNASFVSVEQKLAVHVDGGRLVEMTLDGEGGDEIVASPYHIQAATPDGSVFALGNANTDLFIDERGSREPPREVEEVRGRASGVAISPDGKTVAVSLHQDYDNPLKQGVEHTDDALYLVDVATGDVRVIPASRKGWVLQLSWTKPDVIYMHWRAPGTGPVDQGLALDVASGERELVDWWEQVRAVQPWRAAPKECEAVQLGQDDLGLYTGSRESPSYIISIKGRKRGFHDHFDTIPSYHFAGDCDHVVFVHDMKVYVHQRSSGLTALLGPGHETWYFPKQ